MDLFDYVSYGGDNSFENFKNWIITSGEEVYNMALNNTKAFINYCESKLLEDSEYAFSNELFQSEVREAYEELSGTSY